MFKIIFLMIVAVIFGIGMIIGLSRFFSHRELDDVHPKIMDINDPYLQKSEWLWVIPLYMNDPISKYPEWIDRIKKSGKKIGMHGVKHVHKEFGVDLSEQYIDAGIKEFTKAFGYYPTHFKAPSLALTHKNWKKLRDRGLIIKARSNQVMHTVYHSPSHRIPNGMLIGE